MRIRSHPDRPAPRRRRLIAVATAGALALGGGVIAVAPAQAADEPLEINLVTVNDFHGRIEAAAPVGGIAALAKAVDGIRSTNDRTVFAAAGDMIGASTFTSFIQQDLPTIDTLNDAGLEVSAAGNHEFDKGWLDLRDRVQDAADWEYIAANVFLKGTQETALSESWVKDFGDVSVGFIGAVTEELPSLVSPGGITELDVRPIVASVNGAADRLTDGNAANGEADVLVLLIHEGAANTSYAAVTDSSAFAQIVSGASPKINAIVSGHTHLAYNHEVPYAGDTGQRPVISSGQYGEKFSNMVIQVDPATKTVLSMDNTVYDMYVGTTPQYPVPADDPILAKVNVAKAEAAVQGGVELGKITADFNRAKLAAGTENRGGESTLGNFVADAQLWSARRTDPATQIAFMNPGGLRADMAFAPDGVLTYKEAADVQSFANTLVTLTLTGDQIRQALEQQWQPAGAQRPFLKLGISKGFEYAFDPAAAPGSRILRMTLDGVDIDPAASYRVVANSFLSTGGDNFGAIGQGTNKRDTGQVDLESMVAYMAEVKTATPDYAQRSIGATLPAPAGAQGYEVGSSFDIALSSLDFSTTEPRATTVDVTIGGKPAGTSAIDNTLPTAISDVNGKATVTVTVPEGITGTAKFGTPVQVPLTVTTPRGTSIEIPVTVFERADSSTLGIPSKFLAKRNSSVQFTTIVVAEKGTVVTGEVTISDGDEVIATATLTAKDRGIVKVKLPALDRGVHKLSVSYGGSDTVKPSESPTFPVLVW
ncbi:5'-nucleotidase C-terminal domain-containing protein [Microbacterium sulfonylureivorans]|uniref:5'-nucleotidase C-terminal domain-containing protein n=1 Tax=Microbacterium sulfonylureivorans TaxID=2486854 RepID=UPI000FD95EA7|nr:5'-nucleotidase C-terminal domain-containing protein [Microbacterium sulfonylureivorans]